MLTGTSLVPAYWIAFGPHGPRALPPPDERRRVALYTMYGVGVALVIVWGARQFARAPPPTMTKEYQEQTNEYLKVHSPSFLLPPFPLEVTLSLSPGGLCVGLADGRADGLVC